MKSKDKILKICPTAYANHTPNGVQIFIGEHMKMALSNIQSRESWAWAEAVRLSQCKTNRP
jgi:hypothetical protein